MDPDQRAQVLAEATQRFGEYSGHTYRLKERIRDLDAAQQANESDAEPEGGDA